MIENKDKPKEEVINPLTKYQEDKFTLTIELKGEKLEINIDLFDIPNNICEHQSITLCKDTLTRDARVLFRTVEKLHKTLAIRDKFIVEQNGRINVPYRIIMDEYKDERNFYLNLVTIQEKQAQMWKMLLEKTKGEIKKISGDEHSNVSDKLKKLNTLLIPPPPAQNKE